MFVGCSVHVVLHCTVLLLTTMFQMSETKTTKLTWSTGVQRRSGQEIKMMLIAHEDDQAHNAKIMKKKKIPHTGDKASLEQCG